eukprot:TRINITY_DN71618_c0_g1_i1.p1 TRINITY_DN71618_c0_g1~~TRINITY_DN71618_c0_g1_i1.p1  ORF type:complete len:277 (+),score=49.12 TRINITY_DN71618_c0_g1_i1:82-912(+)
MSHSEVATGVAERWAVPWKKINDGDVIWNDNPQPDLALDILRDAVGGSKDSAPLRLLVPLCGDSPVVRRAFERGLHVDACDGTALAVRRNVDTFDKSVTFVKEPLSSDTPDPSSVVYRATGIASPGAVDTAARPVVRVFLCDFFSAAFHRCIGLPTDTTPADTDGLYDVVHDKDSFGALPPDVRQRYVRIVAAALRAGGAVLLEVKDKRGMAAKGGADADALTTGPPFHMTPDAVREEWGAVGLVVEQHWPVLYPLHAPHGMLQQGYLLRKPRRTT